MNRWEPSLTINGKERGTFKINRESRTFDTPGIKTGEIKIFSFFFVFFFFTTDSFDEW